MRFIYNEPAIFHKGALIIGDTHFGIEERLRQKGIYYSNISNQILKKIFVLLKMTRAKKLIILGDVKERITSIDKTTKNIFERLQKKLEVIVVRGNHDGGIEQICNNVIRSEGFIYEGLGLLHGNAWPNEELLSCRYIVSAHHHPQIEFRDKSGKISIEPGWFILPANKSKIKKYYNNFNNEIKLILMPAFNPLVGKSLKVDAKEQSGPLLTNRLFALKLAEAYRLDGSTLGKLANINGAK